MTRNIFVKIRNRPPPPKKREKSVKFEGKFPPDEADREFPLNLYDNTHCEHYKCEDVSPKFAARHLTSSCYRTEGGDCDKAGARTRREHKNVVREQARLKKQNTTKHKTTTLIVHTYET